jgi:hypothetical protein
MADGRKRKPGRKIGRMQNISHVTMHLDEANRTLKVAGIEEFFYRMRWVIHDKNGESGSYSIINSLTAQEPTDEGKPFPGVRVQPVSSRRNRDGTPE